MQSITAFKFSDTLYAIIKQASMQHHMEMSEISSQISLFADTVSDKTTSEATVAYPMSHSPSSSASTNKHSAPSQESLIPASMPIKRASNIGQQPAQLRTRPSSTREFASQDLPIRSQRGRIIKPVQRYGYTQ